MLSQALQGLPSHQAQPANNYLNNRSVGKMAGIIGAPFPFIQIQTRKIRRRLIG